MERFFFNGTIGSAAAVLGNDTVQREFEAEEQLIRIARQYSSVEFDRWYGGKKDGRLGDDQQARVDKGRRECSMMGSEMEDIKEFIVYLKFLHQFYSVGSDDLDLFVLEDLAMIEMTLYQLKFALDRNFSSSGRLIQDKAFEWIFGVKLEEDFKPVLRSKRESQSATENQIVGKEIEIAKEVGVESKSRFKELLVRVSTSKIEDAPILSEVLQILWEESYDAKKIFNEDLSIWDSGIFMKEYEEQFLAALQNKDNMFQIQSECGREEEENGERVLTIQQAMQIGYNIKAYDENQRIDRILLKTILVLCGDGFVEEKNLERELPKIVFDSGGNEMTYAHVRNRIKGPRLRRYFEFDNGRISLKNEKPSMRWILKVPYEENEFIKPGEWRNREILESFDNENKIFYTSVAEVCDADYINEEMFEENEKNVENRWRKTRYRKIDFSLFWEEYSAGQLVQNGPCHVCVSEEYQQNHMLEKNFYGQRWKGVCNLYSYDGSCVRCGKTGGRVLIRFDDDDSGYWNEGDYDRWVQFKMCQNHFVDIADLNYLHDREVYYQLDVAFLSRLLVRASLGIRGIMETVKYYGKYIDRDKKNFHDAWKWRMKKD